MRNQLSASISAAVLILGAAAASMSAACSSDDDMPNPPADASLDSSSGSSDGGGEASAEASAEGGISGGGEASVEASAEGGTSGGGEASVEASAEASAEGGTSGGGEAGSDAGLEVPTFVAHFDLAQGQLPEGLWELVPGDGGAGSPLVGFAPLATLVTVESDGGTQSFGSIGEAGSAANTFTLGIATDSSGNVYVGVGASGASPVPAPGIYKFPKQGGAGALFSSVTTDAGPAMNFPNGLDFIGPDLYVADSGGTIFKVTPDGTATAWVTHPLLAPDATACGGAVALAIGANGIVHDDNNFYVSNTNFGRIVKIPRGADGGAAGTPTALVESCATLAGADGIALDSKDNSILVAVNAKNTIVRVSQTGTVTTIASGPPLDSPASLFVEPTPSGRRLLVTNAAFFSGDAGRPGLLTLPLP